jgi:hypothetical protein
MARWAVCEPVLDLMWMLLVLTKTRAQVREQTDVKDEVGNSDVPRRVDEVLVARRWATVSCESRPLLSHFDNALRYRTPVRFPSLRSQPHHEGPITASFLSMQ